jgi:hypothetical protein
VLVALGVWLLQRWRTGPSPEPGAYLATGKSPAATKSSTLR